MTFIKYNKYSLSIRTITQTLVTDYGELSKKNEW